MAQFRIPGPLRRLSEGQITVDVEATDLVGAIVALDAKYPGFKDRLLDENGDLRQFVNVYLNDEDVRLGSGLGARVGEKDEISIVPAVAVAASLQPALVPCRLEQDEQGDDESGADDQPVVDAEAEHQR